MTKSSGDAIAPRSSRAMPGVSMMSRAVSPLRPLVISVSLPARMTITVCGSPTPAIAALKPSAIDSTPRKTTTTPAMPMIATADEPSRCRIDRRLTRGDRDDLRQHGLGPPQGVDDAEPLRLERRHGAGREPQHDHHQRRR